MTTKSGIKVDPKVVSPSKGAPPLPQNPTGHKTPSVQK